MDPYAPTFPEPGRYTLATQCAKDPDLAFIIEHPTITGAAQDLLGDSPKLTAYVIYDRAPGGAGLPTHHDYKTLAPGGFFHELTIHHRTVLRFRYCGGSFICLYVAPGSHHLERIRDDRPCMQVDQAIQPKQEDFINPDLKRGDLLLMNMHLWHYADGNKSDHHRVGWFNKYAAASYPPAINTLFPIGI